jgi:isoquinoline 1-oxidoreductase subunit beta
VYGTPAGGGLIQLTGASSSTQGFWDRYRLAAAQARARLAAAAAEAWGVPAEEVEVSSGVVTHRSGTFTKTIEIYRERGTPPRITVIR